MSKFYAGTSGWAYSTWKPDFYPAKLPGAKFLSHYAGRLNTVEVNYTFRAFPTEKLLTGWIDATPAGFQFAIKANQKITHVKRLRDAAGLAVEFLSCLQPLEGAKKLGPVLFQLPPFLKGDVPLLTEFLAGLPRNLRVAFEFRNPSWFTDEVYAALRQKNAALCLAETDSSETPNVQTADFSYLRLRKEKYTPKSFDEQLKRVVELRRQGDVFAYFKHEDTPEGASRAEALLKATGAS
jgi:uncharacterized protein YecE (DUF72 family)